MPSSPFETTVYPPIPNLRIAKSFLARLRTKFEAESATLALTAVALTADALNQGDFLVKQCEFMESKVDHLKQEITDNDYDFTKMLKAQMEEIAALKEEVAFLKARLEEKDGGALETEVSQEESDVVLESVEKDEAGPSNKKRKFEIEEV